ncbi:F390 synthetase-related protein [Agaribacterium sp. ZY112]|uniref:F390 synthetase-related protein n=1 Tax=Agaribacterium sp. ZY112 TaxID=3233574 RepID=UPI003523B110
MMFSSFSFIKGYINGKLGKRMSREQLLAKQSRLFKVLKKEVLKKTEFYKALACDENSALESFPVLDKKALLQNFKAINTLGLTRVQCEQHAEKAERSRDFSKPLRGVSVGLSSGTSGQRGIFLTKPNEQAEWAGYIIAKNLPFRLKPQRVALLLRSNNGLYEASRGLFVRYRFFDLLAPFEDIVQALEAYQPDVLIAPAQLLGQIAERKITISPSKIISVAEVLEEDVRECIEQEYKLRVDEIYQCTEGYIASTCSHGHLHLNEDILVIEKSWLDKDSGRFMPIVTDLRRSSLPIVRFKLDDILQLDHKPCACGSSMLRLAKIEGRNDDSLWLLSADGWQRLFPDVIRRAIMMCSKNYNDYRIEQWQACWHVAVDCDDFDSAQASIRQAIEELAASYSCEPPKIVFKQGIHQSMMQKCRRLACKERPQEEAKNACEFCLETDIT